MASGRLAVVATAVLIGTIGACGSASRGDSGSTTVVADGSMPGDEATARHAGRAGAAGIGDPDFPNDGNGGYDVGHYRLKIDYDPERKYLSGVAGIQAKATQTLSRFDLDLSGFTVGKVTVNGAPARFSRSGDELVVTPSRTIPDRSAFTVEVTYAGEPKPVRNSPNLGTYGFIPTSDGAFVACEPNGARTWFPGNDHPADKARYDFEITVPEGVTALANGEQVGSPVTSDGKTTYNWRESHPMASYLATVTMGRFELREGRTALGTKNVAAVDPRYSGSLNRLYNQSAKITDYWSKVFGPYPFSSTGGVIDDFPAGYALENQTKPMYGGFNPGDDVIAHELAHQWFGDSMSIRRWRDLWLNEGFATYAEWLWSEHKGNASAERIFRNRYAVDSGAAIWKYAPGRAKPDDLFNDSVYTRGAMTLHALRQRIGDPAFFRVLKTWNAEHKYGYVTTPEFVALSERISGKRLDDLFDAWLFTPRKPTTW